MKGPNKGKSKDTDIDHLLKQALKDDIPPDVEISMKEQLDKLRLKMEEGVTEKMGAGRKAFRGKVSFIDVRWAHFLFKKEALVVVSLLMIVLGGFIQSSGASNQLTLNLSILGTSVAVSDQMSRSHSMECSIQLSGENQKPLNYSIQWLSPNLSKIQVKESENIPLKTIWVSEEDITIADHANDRVYKETKPELFDDPIIQPIVRYLAPTDLVERMYGEWELKRSEKIGECSYGIFTVFLPNEKALLEMTVDHCVYLPVSIKEISPAEKQSEKKSILNVKFTWNAPLSPEHFSPKSTKGNHKAC